MAGEEYPKAHEGEQIMRAFSTHWIKYVMPTFVFTVVMTGVLGVLAGSYAIHENIAWLADGLLLLGVCLLTLTHHWFFHKLLSEAMEDIIITNKRIIWIKEALYQTDDMRQIPLDRIQGVEAKKHGLLQTVLRYGSIWFDTGGTVTSDENAIMDQVPHPNHVAREINQLLELS